MSEKNHWLSLRFGFTRDQEVHCNHCAPNALKCIELCRMLEEGFYISIRDTRSCDALKERASIPLSRPSTHVSESTGVEAQRWREGYRNRCVGW